MKGIMCSKGYNISERRISQSLIRVAHESYEQRRQDTHDKLNPIPYVARYYGHKLHIDQNEKLMHAVWCCTACFSKRWLFWKNCFI